METSELQDRIRKFNTDGRIDETRTGQNDNRALDPIRKVFI